MAQPSIAWPYFDAHVHPTCSISSVHFGGKKGHSHPMCLGHIDLLLVIRRCTCTQFLVWYGTLQLKPNIEFAGYNGRIRRILR